MNLWREVGWVGDSGVGGWERIEGKGCVFVEGREVVSWICLSGLGGWVFEFLFDVRCLLVLEIFL